MKTFLFFLGLGLAPLCGRALSLPLRPAVPAPIPVFRHTGTLECRVAIGGETTGWVLRIDQKQRLELLLPPDAFAWIREGMVVTVTGVYATKHYPERGDVTVFVVHQISQVPT